MEDDLKRVETQLGELVYSLDGGSVVQTQQPGGGRDGGRSRFKRPAVSKVDN